jgi:hypothetical protein
MKKQVSPALIAAAVVLGLILLGGLYYKFLGGGSVSQESAVASPYGMPKSGEGFKTPPPGGSGINTITGEPLSASVKDKTNHPFPGSAASPGGSMPSLPPGAKVKP